MTKHDDDLAEAAERPEVSRLTDLVERYRALEQSLEWIRNENAALRVELARTTEQRDYYRRLTAERFGFEPVPPPGSILNE